MHEVESLANRAVSPWVSTQSATAQRAIGNSGWLCWRTACCAVDRTKSTRRGRLRGVPPLAHPGPSQDDREGPRIAAASRCRFAAKPRARFRTRDVMCLTSARDHCGGAASLSEEQLQSHLNLPRRSDGAYDSSECAVGNCHRPTGDGHAEHG